MNESKEHYKFMQNRECEYFPCHKGVKEEDFNCLFCYCPLYALGRKCGGACSYLGNGSKSCAACSFPHRRENYEKVLARFQDIQSIVRRTDQEDK